MIHRNSNCCGISYAIKIKVSCDYSLINGFRNMLKSLRYSVCCILDLHFHSSMGPWLWNDPLLQIGNGTWWLTPEIAASHVSLIPDYIQYTDTKLRIAWKGSSSTDRDQTVKWIRWVRWKLNCLNNWDIIYYIVNVISSALYHRIWPMMFVFW